jgi:hypothetical protein
MWRNATRVRKGLNRAGRYPVGDMIPRGRDLVDVRPAE